MCRFAFSANGLVFYRPLACSTSADELYHEAKRQTDNLKARLVAVEPCAFAFAEAVAPRSATDIIASVTRPHAGDPSNFRRLTER